MFGLDALQSMRCNRCNAIYELLLLHYKLFNAINALHMFNAIYVLQIMQCNLWHVYMHCNPCHASCDASIAMRSMIAINALQAMNCKLCIATCATQTMSCRICISDYAMQSMRCTYAQPCVIAYMHDNLRNVFIFLFYNNKMTFAAVAVARMPALVSPTADGCQLSYNPFHLAATAARPGGFFTACAVSLVTSTDTVVSAGERNSDLAKLGGY